MSDSLPIRRLGRPGGQAATRLLCLPPAGAGASIFHPLLSLDSSEVEICPVTLPGREDRFQEPLPESINDLADIMARELAPALDRPTAILGYSMGAILGYELIRRWRAWRLPEPILFFALASRAPQIPLGLEVAIHEQSSAEFRQTLRDLGGTNPELIDNDEVMSIYEPILRCDFRNCDTYEHIAMKPLACPIQAFVGAQDSLMTPADAQAWKECTESNFTLHVLPNQPHMLPEDEFLRIGKRVCESLKNRTADER